MTNLSIPYVKRVLQILLHRLEEPRSIPTCVLVRAEDGLFFVDGPCFISPDQELVFSLDAAQAKLMPIEDAEMWQENLEYHHRIVTAPVWAGRTYEC